MNAWLAAQANNNHMKVVNGTIPQAPLSEQLNPQEEKYAREHKGMMKNMIDQYGKEKGNRVFYATVREKVKKLNEAALVKDVRVNPRTEPKVPDDIPEPGPNELYPSKVDAAYPWRKSLFDYNPAAGGFSNVNRGFDDDMVKTPPQGERPQTRPQPRPQP